jgi:Ca-activated chloride channel homolog
MKRWVIGAFVLCAAAVIAQETVIRVDVNLVRVLATVKNDAGDLVGSLDAEDFEVHDNGVKQTISLFERQTQQPLSVAVLIDNSGSTAAKLKSELESVDRFLTALFSEGHPEDRAALFTFNWEVVKRSSFTRNQGGLRRAMRSIKSEAGTALYDAIYLASQTLESREGRRVLLAVTDGSDTVSVRDFHAALRAAQMADAVIYAIVIVPIAGDAGRSIGGENALITMAERTGGRAFFPNLGPALDNAFTEVLRDLRTQYLIGFYPKDVPPSKDPFHRLDISVRRPNLRVSARSGYYGVSEGTPGSSGARISIEPTAASEASPEAGRAQQEQE